MRNLLCVFLLVCSSFAAHSQKTKFPARHYPSLLWEISGKGMKPSYLFGTMHVSSKMVFHLSDSFYLGIRNADVVALETDMGKWQEDFSRYEMEEELTKRLLAMRGGENSGDYLRIGTFQYPSYIKTFEYALAESPSMINSFLYRNYSERSADQEEDTYLDLHIYQAGRKWGKKVCGVEDFDESMQLMREAYLDAAREKEEKQQRRVEYDEDLSYANMEMAYRTGNLDLLDTINKANSRSAAFDEKFLYRRNEIQARSIDSIIRKGNRLFVGVGAAHLPGQRGVIEMLRDMGYTLRPIKMTERDSRHKEEVEKIRVPVTFSRQTSADGFFSVQAPGKLYSFSSNQEEQQVQYADMSNGSYYTITRIPTGAALQGHSEAAVLRKIDSVLYENIPGKILQKRSIERNGYKGFEVANRTRRGDHQRYQIFATPFEIVIFKMSGNGDYVIAGKEAGQFFSTIELRPIKGEWKKWSPSFGGFEAELPHAPLVVNDGSMHFQSVDRASNTGFDIIRTDLHQYDFVEEDSFDLGLMEESFSSSEFIARTLSRRQTRFAGYPALDAEYRYKDSSVARVRFLIRGPHYYALVAHADKPNARMDQFLNSFRPKPYQYGTALNETDTSLRYSVRTPVPIKKSNKLSMYPEGIEDLMSQNEETMEQTDYKTHDVQSDSTGERIQVSRMRLPSYTYEPDSANRADTLSWETRRMKWIYRKRQARQLPDGTRILDYEIGSPSSSRYVKGRFIGGRGINYRIETQLDTLTAPSAFVTQFFESFMPGDSLAALDVRAKKAPLFFSDFRSIDSVRHRKAIVNISSVSFDSADFPALKNAIASLTWKEKRYLDAKKDFISAMGKIPTRSASDYLKEAYRLAGDTVELQYAALEALLLQRTAYSFAQFRDILVNDPPVLNMGSNDNIYRSYRNNPRFVWNLNQSNGQFFDDLRDSLQLTAGIMRDLLPLSGVSDYEQPLLRILATLVDSNLVRASDYESLLPKLLLEGKQALKKQLISEKQRSIAKARVKEEEEDDDARDEEDEGNSELELFARLLMPFYERNAAVPAFMNSLLQSSDRSLRHASALLFLQHGRTVHDSTWKKLAEDDEYRYTLYEELNTRKKLALFPSAFAEPVLLARSMLMGESYQNPDTLVYLDKLPARIRDYDGHVYFFKYKNNKNDNNWKLGLSGILPKQAPYVWTADGADENLETDAFTDLSQEKLDESEAIRPQLEKLLKRYIYRQRNSSAMYYAEDYGMKLMRQFR